MSRRRMPLQIKGLTLPSRLIMAPMASAKATEEGLVTDALIGFYRERTEDGALGLVVLEHAYILPRGQAKARQLSIAGEEAVDQIDRREKGKQKHGRAEYHSVTSQTVSSSHLA